MFQTEQYTASLTTLLQERFGDRLAYVGLQGSYLRGEATPESDIDVMVVVRDLSVADLRAYREAISQLPEPEKSCGFICSTADLRSWNPLEICHLLHTTRDCFGVLAELAPSFAQQDVRTFVQMSVSNLYHEICHRYIHAPGAVNVACFSGTCKGTFFILQNLHYLESGVFAATRQKLLQRLQGRDRQVLAMSMACGRGEAFDFEEAFALLFAWCGEVLERLSTGRSNA